MDNEGLLEKQNIFKRIFHLFEFNPSRAYDNLIIAFVGFAVSLLLAKYLGYINVSFSMVDGIDINKHFDYWLGYGFLVIEGIIVLFMIRKISLEEMKKEIPIFIFLIVLATFTAYLGSLNLHLLIFVDALWAVIVCITQLQDKNMGLIGLYTGMIYVYLIAAVSTFYETSWIWLGETCIFIVACVIITSIPMFIIRIIKHNPYKREKLANCFRTDLKFHEFNVLKDELLSIDRSERMISLLSLANEFFIANSNINTFSNYLEGNKDFELFVEEIDRLMDKLRKSILKGSDREFEINIGYITEFQKNLKFELDSIPNKNPDQLLLDASIRKYKSLFEDLNQVLEDRKTINTISLPENKSILNAFKNMNLSDSNIRYSFAVVISIFAAFFLDELFIYSIIYITSLITAFTINSSLDNTQKEIIIRSIFTFVGVIIGICIIFLFEFLGIYAFLGILAIIAFALFFVFKDDPQLSLIFIMLGFIFLIPEKSIMMSFEHLLATICSVIIILVVTTLLTPNQKETNIIKLFKFKSHLIREYTLLRFNKNKRIDIVSAELSKVNFDILNLLERFSDTFRDIEEDIIIFRELNSAFDNYVDTLNNIHKNIEDKNISYDLSSFINMAPDLFNWYLNQFEGKESDFPDINKELEDFLIEISKEDSPINFTYPLFNNLIINLTHIYELLIQIQEKELYDIYDTKLIDHDLKNNFTLDNFRYILNHFRYVFVVYRYFNKFAKDSTDTVFEEFSSIDENTVHNIYNSSKKYADKFSKQGRKGIDKIYTSSGEIIELSNEELNSIYELSKDNWKFATKFVKIVYGMTLKPFIHSRFKIRFYKDNEK